MLPGTRQVTIGSAIGADIHGKNHYSHGSFGNHMESLDLLTADGMSVSDTISLGPKLGRAGFTRGSLATLDQLPPKLRRDPLRFNAPQLFTVPDIFPSGMVNRVTTRIATEAAYRMYPKHGRGTIQNLTQFYHPLDLLGSGIGPTVPAGSCSTNSRSRSALNSNSPTSSE